MIKRYSEVIDEPSFSQEIYEYGQGSPKVIFTAGIHGDEVTGIYVAENLIEYFNKNEPIKGTVKIMPRCNPVATRHMSRRAFYDDTDMNRIFPGNNKGTPTFRAAYNIWQETKEMEIIIDLHCCGQHGMTYVLAMYDEFPEVKELCMKLTMPRLVKSEGTSGQLFTESCRNRGQKAFIIELPSGRSAGSINFEAAKECYEALLNLLRSEGVIAGKYIHNPPTAYDNIKDIIAKDNGLWMPNVVKGQKIEKGHALGKLNNKNIIADKDGTILMVRPGSYLYVDDYIISYIKEM